jgi:protein-disulfide isomerase
LSPRIAPSGLRRWWFPLTVLLAAAALVVTILVIDRSADARTDAGAEPAAQHNQEAEAQNGDAATEVQDPERAAFTEAETRDEDDLQAIGPVDAPVALVVFSDYQCPYCAAWSTDTLPTMMEYVDAGQMRIEWRDVNVFGSESEQAAKAAHAAAQQDEFWEFHDALFAGGEHRSADQLSAEALIELADEQGLDTAQFEEDMESPETQAAVEAYAQMGLDLGAFSTPTFLVGGEPIVGAQPTVVFVDAVEAALAADQ